MTQILALQTLDTAPESDAAGPCFSLFHSLWYETL